jgi:type VI secretion system secreted protein VgrG
MSGAVGERLLSFTANGSSTLLQPVGFSAEEAISEPFSVTVDLISDQSSIDPDSVLYKPACLSMIRQTGGTRYFHGLVRAFAGTGAPVRGKWSYRAVLAPRLWFMSQTSDCRIFQQMSVSAIVSARCGEVSQTLSDVTTAQPTREYVTQYNETDLDFVHRLLEQEGYFYYFVHSDSDHVLTLCNQNPSFPTSPKPSMYVVHEGGTPSTLTNWRKVRATTHGVVNTLDYDPTAPSTLPSGTSATTLGTTGAATRDVFRWPARWFAAGDAGDRAKYEMEAAEAAVTLQEATGENHMFSAGSRFTLAMDPFDQSTGTDYVIQRVSHAARDDSWVTGGGGQPVYGNRLTAFPAATNWRQPIATPKPVLGGIYSALVLGDSGEEIHADQYGRIKVQLLFDHRGDTTADKGVWARIIQPWAGNTWGWQHLPRVGAEVAVSFMDGDPDRPVVVGGLYNANMQPVFPIPAEQTKSGFRSRSTTGGSSANCSEWWFDDKKGSELVFLHAEKDRTTEVENNDSLTVTNNRTHTIKQQETISVGDTQTITVKNDRTTTISEGNDSFTVSKGDHSTTISTGNHSTTVSQGNHSTTVSMGNSSTGVSMGDLSIKVDLGSVTIEAMQSITLKVGSSSVTISQEGVTVDGMQLAVGGGSTLQTAVKGLMVQTNGEAMAQHQGAIMMIN